MLSNVKKNVANILLFLRNANPEYNLRYVSRASKSKFACCFVLAIAGGFYSCPCNSREIVLCLKRQFYLRKLKYSTRNEEVDSLVCPTCHACQFGIHKFNFITHVHHR